MRNDACTYLTAFILGGLTTLWVCLFYNSYTIRDWLGMGLCYIVMCITVPILLFNRNKVVYLGTSGVICVIGVAYAVCQYLQYVDRIMDIDGRFRNIDGTIAMHEFHRKYHCCGKEGPTDYSAPPDSCCNSTQVSNTTFELPIPFCQKFYDQGCLTIFRDLTNTYECWRVICDAVRFFLILFICILFLRLFLGIKDFVEG